MVNLFWLQPQIRHDQRGVRSPVHIAHRPTAHCPVACGGGVPVERMPLQFRLLEIYGRDASPGHNWLTVRKLQGCRGLRCNELAHLAGISIRGGSEEVADVPEPGPRARREVTQSSQPALADVDASRGPVTAG